MKLEKDVLGNLSEQVFIVLVQTSHSGNIGAVARAMKNMGLNNLRLVSPNNYPSEESAARASGAADVLDSAQVFDSLSRAIHDINWIVGASARIRSFPWPVMNPRECAHKVVDLLNRKQASFSDGGDNFQHSNEVCDQLPRIALVFGRESSGLTNDELQQCNAHVHIPANPDYSSLNLAMAVQVLSYELRMEALLRQGADDLESVTGPESEDWDAEISSAADVEGLLGHFERVMTSTGFFDPANPGMLLPRLRRLFQRRMMDKMEVNILRGILKSVEKKYKS